jgi:hypothetical protein
MIQQGRYDELVTRLTEINIDLTESINKQGSDIIYYAYFLLLIIDICNSKLQNTLSFIAKTKHNISGNTISYHEAIRFITNVKQLYKRPKSKPKQKSLKTTSCKKFPLNFVALQKVNIFK